GTDPSRRKNLDPRLRGDDDATLRQFLTTLPPSIRTRYTLGTFCALSCPAGPCLMKAMSPLTPCTFTPQSALVIAAASGLPAALMPSTMVKRPSQPRKPSVRPPAGRPFAFHADTKRLATSGFLTASGNQGVKNTTWREPSAA